MLITLIYNEQQFGNKKTKEKYTFIEVTKAKLNKHNDQLDAFKLYWDAKSETSTNKHKKDFLNYGPEMFKFKFFMAHFMELPNEKLDKYYDEKGLKDNI